ncbi:hypothetical protein [Streptomyces sp. NPDC001500]
MRKFTKAAVITAACATLATGLSTGQASAVGEVQSYQISGSEGYSNGNITFFNRSVRVSGTVKSNTTGCVRVSFSGWVSNGGQLASEKGYEERTACGRGTGTSKGFNFTMDVSDSHGGFDFVFINLWTVDANGHADESVAPQQKYVPVG